MNLGLADKIFSFASDGASVMMGSRSGVATRLFQRNKYLVVTHCIAHRLALACNSAQKNSIFCNEVEMLIKNTYKFFKNSAKRIEILTRNQEVLNHPILKIHKIFDVRWLSWFQAVKNLCLSIEPLMDTLTEVIIDAQDSKNDFFFIIF